MPELHPDTTTAEAESEGTPDFREALKTASEHAPHVRIGKRLENGEYVNEGPIEESEPDDGLESLQDAPDFTVLNIDPEFPKNTVSTQDPEEYYALVQQAHEVLHGKADEAHVADIVRHERQHGEAAPKHLKIHYAVSVYKTINPESGAEVTATQPSVIPEGSITKIDLATIFAAPDDLSEDDKRSLQAMGYDSAQEVAERRKRLVDPPKVHEIGHVAIEHNPQTD